MRHANTKGALARAVILAGAAGLAFLAPGTAQAHFRLMYPPQWIVEGGVRLNNSSPGSVNSVAQFLAVTQGRDRHHYLILRLGAGHEAYELIAPSSALVNFPSQEVSLTWRQWLSRDWGFTLGGGYYRNSAYRRTGVTVGSFKTF